MPLASASKESLFAQKNKVAQKQPQQKDFNQEKLEMISTMIALRGEYINKKTPLVADNYYVFLKKWLSKLEREKKLLDTQTAGSDFTTILNYRNIVADIKAIKEEMAELQTFVHDFVKSRVKFDESTIKYLGGIQNTQKAQEEIVGTILELRSNTERRIIPRYIDHVLITPEFQIFFTTHREFIQYAHSRGYTNAARLASGGKFLVEANTILISLNDRFTGRVEQ